MRMPALSLPRLLVCGYCPDGIREVQNRVANAKYYQLYYDQYLPPAVGQSVNDATQGLFAGTSSPEEVAQTIEESAEFELTP